MSELSPCPACRRHVRGASCPFCGEGTPRRPPIDLGAGRVSRAIVFASATLAASTGCAHRQHASDGEGLETQERHAGGGGCFTDEQRIAELEKEKAEVDKEPDSEDKQIREQELDRKLKEARTPQCMPYGAPPARRRVV
ncbi:MAG TPA: hypothetical protein VL326_14095 [Kofleriaceae bacterium]|jgi:hypothetical protein|nr:hypothetical protein [Kofleriaceae bacterium]